MTIDIFREFQAVCSCVFQTIRKMAVTLYISFLHAIRRFKTIHVSKSSETEKNISKIKYFVIEEKIYWKKKL